MDNSTIWILLGLIALIVIIAVVMLLGKQRTQARAEASELRERAAVEEPVAQDREAVAQQTQEQARLAQEEAAEAQARADNLQTRASEATQDARAERDRVTEDYLEADDIDPDVKG